MKPTTSAAMRIQDQKPYWEPFVGLWEHENLTRPFLCSQVVTKERVLLTHFLTRIRGFFKFDLCFATLFLNDDQPLEVGLPEASLPANFASRCVDLIVNPRVPVAWERLCGNLAF